MAIAIRPTLVRIPVVDIQFELSARDKKVLSVAIATLALFGLQFGLSLGITLAATFVFTALTFLSEKYIRTEPHQQNDWFNTQFNKKEMAFLATFILLRPFIIQIVCLGLGIPLPIVAQEGIANLLFSRPWTMIPIVAIVAPIAEEILFRGFFLERLEDTAHLLNRYTFCALSRNVQQKVSNFAQGVIFGALHLRQKIKDGWQIPIFLMLSLVGYVYGQIKRYNRSLISPMVLHSANNTSAVIYMFATQK